MNPAMFVSPRELLDLNRRAHMEGFVAGAIFAIGSYSAYKVGKEIFRDELSVKNQTKKWVKRKFTND